MRLILFMPSILFPDPAGPDPTPAIIPARTHATGPGKTSILSDFVQKRDKQTSS